MHPMRLVPSFIFDVAPRNFRRSAGGCAINYREGRISNGKALQKCIMRTRSTVMHSGLIIRFRHRAFADCVAVICYKTHELSLPDETYFEEISSVIFLLSLSILYKFLNTFILLIMTKQSTCAIVLHHFLRVLV